MRSARRRRFVLGLMLALVVLSARWAGADNCADESDCQAAPRNIDVATGVAAGAAGLALGTAMFASRRGGRPGNVRLGGANGGGDRPTPPADTPENRAAGARGSGTTAPDEAGTSRDASGRPGGASPGDRPRGERPRPDIDIRNQPLGEEGPMRPPQ